MNIAVATTCYDQGRFLAAAIESVLAQTHEQFQYLIVDDGSSDDTWKIAEKYRELDSRISTLQLPKQKNLGQTLNYALACQQPFDYWVWAPADDLLRPRLLERKVALAEKHPNAVIYSHGEVINIDGQVTGSVRPPGMTPQEFRAAMRRAMPIGFTGIWIPASVFRTVGAFSDKRAFSEDFQWALRACKNGVDFLGVSEILYRKRTHENRITARHLDEIRTEIPRIREEVGYDEPVRDEQAGGSS